MPKLKLIWSRNCVRFHLSFEWNSLCRQDEKHLCGFVPTCGNWYGQFISFFPGKMWKFVILNLVTSILHSKQNLFCNNMFRCCKEEEAGGFSKRTASSTTTTSGDCGKLMDECSKYDPPCCPGFKCNYGIQYSWCGKV